MLKVLSIDDIKKEELRDKFKEFLETILKEEFIEVRDKGKQFLLIDYYKFAEFFYDFTISNKQLPELLLEYPDEIIRLLEDILEKILLEDYFISPEEFQKISIRFRNLPEHTKRKIGEIRSRDVGKFVTIEGIIRRVSQIKVMEIETIYKCPECGSVFSISFGQKTPKVCPICKKKPNLGFEVVGKKVDDVQQIVIEDVWENLDPHEQPQRIHVLIRGDLTDPKLSKRYTPGNKVIVYGIVDLIAPKKSKKEEQIFIVRANYIESKEYSFEEIKITPEDEKKIKELAKRKDIYDLFIESVAPSIFGHKAIKEAIVLQLFGGNTVLRPDGTRSRGDIHILLVGDPGVGKSITYSQKILYFDEEKSIYFENIGDFFNRFYEKYKNQVKIKGDSEIIEISENLYAVSINPITKEIELKRIKAIIRHKSPEEVVYIKTKNKREIIVTKDHSILVLENDKIKIKKGDEIRRGDILLVIDEDDILKLYEGKEVKYKVDIVKEVKIKKIKDVEENWEYVYDLSIEDNENFLANFIFVHNSQILLHIASIAPKARYISAKGASAAGITATVVRDEMLGTWAVEAGALVLAHKGILCLDEMDKMSKEDRDALHTAMEQQIITIDKANIHVTLRSETSILAAANPKGGRFREDKPIIEQIDLPPTLLSRFDLIFPIRDLPDKNKDLQIASQVIEAHKVPEKFKPKIDVELMRKYIAYAKKNIKPKISEEAAERIKKFYIELREKGKQQDLVTITTRQLEAIIRLAEASAKVRLSNIVTVEDVERAIRLLMESLKEIGIADSAGMVDIDAIYTGATKSKRRLKDLILDVVEELAKKEEYKDGVPISIIIREVAKKLKVEEDEIAGDVEDILDILHKNGEILQPTFGKFLPVY